MAEHMRAEARPATWTELDQHQKEAFKYIAAMLDEALKELRQPKPSQDGDRGSSFRVVRTRSSRLRD